MITVLHQVLPEGQEATSTLNGAAQIFNQSQKKHQVMEGSRSRKIKRKNSHRSEIRKLLHHSEENFIYEYINMTKDVGEIDIQILCYSDYDAMFSIIVMNSG